MACPAVLPKSSDDGLFLLEVLIDKITFTKNSSCSHENIKVGVVVQCLFVDPFEISEESGPSIIRPDGVHVMTFNSGKSCLFSLKEYDIFTAMRKFPVKITVYTALPCGCIPHRIVLGEATIDMTKEFVQARNKYKEDPNNVSYQALRDSFRIIGTDGEEAGEIIMFLRISCFGKLIVTKFQGSSCPPPMCAETHASHEGTVYGTSSTSREFQVYQVSEAPPSGEAPQAKFAGQPCITSGHAPGGICPPARDPYNSMPCEEPDDPCYCTGPKKPQKTQLACRNIDPYCLHIPKGRSKEYEEIGMNLTGNELKIKVPASAAIIKKISQTHCALQTPYPGKKGGADGPCESPCGKNQISLALPSEATCCRGAQLADTQFTCTTEGCTQASKHGQQASMARSEPKQELPNKDVFVLKVAKNALQGDRKCKLELELVAPKAGEKRLPVQKVNMKVQSDEDCVCCSRRPRLKRRRPPCPQCPR